MNYLDFSLMKKTRVTERIRGELRFDVMNSLNRPFFKAPNTSPTSKAFGQVTSAANLPRIIQVAFIATF